MILSACGLICDECEFYGKECIGCKGVKGQTFWAKEMMPDKTCPLFNCSVNVKGFKSCGDCKELPCTMFREMKDPNNRTRTPDFIGAKGWPIKGDIVNFHGSLLILNYRHATYSWQRIRKSSQTQ